MSKRKKWAVRQLQGRQGVTRVVDTQGVSKVMGWTFLALMCLVIAVSVFGVN